MAAARGDPGESYLLIDAGEVEVSQGGHLVRTLGPGAGLGEIALLHDVPRTASVRANGPVDAFSLEHGAFLEAVTGQQVSLAAAEATASERLAADADPGDRMVAGEPGPAAEAPATGPPPGLH